MARYQIFEHESVTTSTEQQEIDFSEQKVNHKILRQANVFICGLNTSAQSALIHLARSGVENFAISDTTHLGHLTEPSASLSAVTSLRSTGEQTNVSNIKPDSHTPPITEGRKFTESVRDITDTLLSINPNIRVRWFDKQGIQELPRILERYPIVINGLTQTREKIHLYRYAKTYSATIIDHYTSVIPSVFITTHLDPTPEQRLTGINSKNTSLQSLSTQFINQFLQSEKSLVENELKRLIEKNCPYDSTRNLESALPVDSNAMITGNLMAVETLKFLLSPHLAVNYLGYFFNPITLSVQTVITDKNLMQKKVSLWVKVKNLFGGKQKRKPSNVQSLSAPIRRYSKQDITNI